MTHDELRAALPEGTGVVTSKIGPFKVLKIGYLYAHDAEGARHTCDFCLANSVGDQHNDYFMRLQRGERFDTLRCSDVACAGFGNVIFDHPKRIERFVAGIVAARLEGNS